MDFQIKELTIPVPWGHIAAKCWGNEDDEMVLVLHGKLDNAGSFDGLIPLLPPNFYYICIDFPGHGKSSDIPQFFFIHTLDFIPVLKLLVDHFKKKSYIIIGHSFGAYVAVYLARLYPQHVKKLIAIDCIVLPSSLEIDQMKNHLVTSIDKVVKMYDKTPKKYTYQETLERVQNSRYGETLSKEAAAALFNRSVESVGDGKYILTTDHLSTVWLDALHDKRYSLECLDQHPVLCPVLFILANQTHPRIKEAHKSLEVVNKWKNAVVKSVDGTHDVHMTHPERVAPFISEFLVRQQSKM